jgi:hypothetical protein
MTPEPPINPDVQPNQSHYQHMLACTASVGRTRKSLAKANHEAVELFRGRELEVGEKQLLIRGYRCEASDRDRLGAQAEQPTCCPLLTLFSFEAPI